MESKYFVPVTQDMSEEYFAKKFQMLFNDDIPRSSRDASMQNNTPVFRAEDLYLDYGYSNLAREGIVPEQTFEFQCPNCQESLADEVTELVESQKDLALAKVACKSCGMTNNLTALKAEHPFTIAKQYIWFGDLDDEWDDRTTQEVIRVFGPCEEYDE